MTVDVRALAETVSNQSRAANKLLVAVLTVAFVVYVGREEPAIAGVPQLLKVPLLGTRVPPELFFRSSLVILSLLMIAFASSQSQAHLALVDAHRRVTETGDGRLRKELNINIVGTLSRMAPIDGALEDAGLKSKILRLSVYTVLKTVYWGAAIAFPVFALDRCFREMGTAPSYCWVLAVVATVLFMVLLGLECIWVWKRFWRS